MYETLLTIFADFLGVAQGSMQYSVCEVVSTLCCLFVLVLPFFIVYKIICMIMG